MQIDPTVVDALLDSVHAVTIRFSLRALDRYVPRKPFAADIRGRIGEVLHGTPEYEQMFALELPDDGRDLGRLSGGEGAPRPYVLRGRPADVVEGGELLEVDLTLLRPNPATLRPWIDAVLHATEGRLGRRPGAGFVPERIDIGTPGSLYEQCAKRWCALNGGDAAEALVRVELATPARLLSKGEELSGTPSVLARTLARRLDSLARLYGAPPPAIDARALGELAREVEDRPEWTSDLSWIQAWRYSSRQGQPVPLHGCVGWWSGTVPRWLGLLILAGEIVHVGKGTTQGLGVLDVRIQEERT